MPPSDPSAFLVEEDGAASTFGGLGEVIEAKGLCCSFHTDHGTLISMHPRPVRSTGYHRCRSARLSPNAASGTLAGIVIVETANQYLRAE